MGIREAKISLVYNYRELVLLHEQNWKKSCKIINLRLETVCHNNEDREHQYSFYVTLITDPYHWIQRGVELIDSTHLSRKMEFWSHTFIGIDQLKCLKFNVDIFFVIF